MRCPTCNEILQVGGEIDTVHYCPNCRFVTTATCTNCLDCIKPGPAGCLASDYQP